MAKLREHMIRVERIDPFVGNGTIRNMWNHLLTTGPTNTIFQTWEWQKSWWQTFGRGELLVSLATKAERPVAIAPFFSEAGMVFFVGSGGSDYLDFIGNVSDKDILAALLDNARVATKEFVGFRFYHIPDASSTPGQLATVADQLELVCFDEGELPSPSLDLNDDDKFEAAINKKSLKRRERWFEREGELTITEMSLGDEILPHLETFFDQHIRRWAPTPFPSLFHDEQQRDFYRLLAGQLGDAGWLRFLNVNWNGDPIAFHFGFLYNGTFLWYKPSFEIDLAKRSPGEVLLRQLLIRAREQGATNFDFGLGDESFKSRFADQKQVVRTWGLYPQSTLDQSEFGSQRVK